MSKKYVLKDRIDENTASELSDHDNLTKQLLYSRGVKTKGEADFFLNPDFDKHLHDPFLLPDMEKAILRILEAFNKDEKIGIWSDYDADGIPGGALLHDFFKLIGFNNFVNYIPNRHTEGYGMNKEGIMELAEGQVKLLITIDCGIRDHAQVEYAKKMGMDVIVTDHHEPASSADMPASAISYSMARPASAPQKEASRGKPSLSTAEVALQDEQVDDLPNAFAVVNPKRSDSKYPEKILCGSGVVWKLIEGILKTIRSSESSKSDLSKKLATKKIEVPKLGSEKWLLDLVGIATLSDMVPLTGENRVLASYGLLVLRKTQRAGLNKLFQMLRMNKNHLSEDDIAFMITPRINAASRMGHPIDAFNLLVAKGSEEAETYAKHLDHINNERKGIVASITKEANKKIKEKILSAGERPVIVLGNPDWRPSLLGLVANKVAEEYRKPVFLWGREGGETIKGSCRSDGETNLVAIMERASSVFLEFGGHKLSGGFSVSYEKIHTLEEILVDACTHSQVKELENFVDDEIKLRDVNQKLVDKIFNLAPFGVGNEKPTFIFRNVIPEKINRFGKKKEHLSINFRDGLETKKAISFFTSPDQFGDLLKEGMATNVVANIEKSFYNGSSEIRLRIVDLFV